MDMCVVCDQKDFPGDSLPLARLVGSSNCLQLSLLLSCSICAVIWLSHPPWPVLWIPLEGRLQIESQALVEMPRTDHLERLKVHQHVSHSFTHNPPRIRLLLTRRERWVFEIVGWSWSLSTMLFWSQASNLECRARSRTTPKQPPCLRAVSSIYILLEPLSATVR